jgi:hypothetical protein
MIRYIPPTTERWIDEEGCRGVTVHDGYWDVDWLLAMTVLLTGLAAISGILWLVAR